MGNEFDRKQNTERKMGRIDRRTEIEREIDIGKR